MLVLHYTGMPTAEEAIARMCDPRAKVSAHYAVMCDGSLIQLVDEEMRAWHAGVACWAGQDDINSCSIGVELINPGHDWGYEPFPVPQMDALIRLCQGIVRRHSIPGHRVLAHSDVAFRRKRDPGEKFDWAALAQAGIGLWPAECASSEGQGRGSVDRNADAAAVRRVQRSLRRIGYHLELTGAYDPDTALCVSAFQRHWRQDLVDGVADLQCDAILKALRRSVTSSGGRVDDAPDA